MKHLKTDVRETWLDGEDAYDWMEWLQNSRIWFPRLMAAVKDPYMTRTELGTLIEDSMTVFMERKRELEIEEMGYAMRQGAINE